jgi:glucose/arabinose dehydrogenase
MKKFLSIIVLSLLCNSNIYSQNLKFTKIVNLDNPWGSSFINDYEMIITEKDGKIKIVNIKNKNISIVDHNLNFLVDGQGGLLDIIYKEDYFWISYTENRGNKKTSTSIARGKFNRDKINFKNIFQANPPINSGYHFGSRLVIKKNYLFA